MIYRKFYKYLFLNGYFLKTAKEYLTYWYFILATAETLKQSAYNAIQHVKKIACQFGFALKTAVVPIKCQTATL